MDIFLDTSFIISLLLETEKTEGTRKFFNETSDSFITSVSVYEETFFVGIKMIAEDRLNIVSSYSLRDYIKKVDMILQIYFLIICVKYSNQYKSFMIQMI
ncbi:MAG: hypothetical protein MPEBLZ_00461 [Candidatus Methanoperedens nitroreducens]|uniref:PIN domain-containing protein n=1 Tax=Candidatus Methanoperedens nitratireducens TaxID=1392998 RepID=A0A0P7ZLE7_9EURY|nr:MAG: hypothetical protein MPEBLZ_00461 [Candidatus Methanoperedens sp. BLZ1]